jgi:hypothetical protein
MLIRCIRALAVTSLVASLLLCGLNHNHVNDNDNNENDPQPSQLRRHLSAWLDPKTVVGKSLGSMSHHSNVNHGLDPSLRIVAFGTSKTWGAGLDHPENEVHYIYDMTCSATFCSFKVSLSQHCCQITLFSIYTTDLCRLVITDSTQFRITLDTCRLSIALFAFHDWY